MPGRDAPPARRPLAAFLPFPALLERFRPGQVRADLYGLFARFGSSEPIAQSLAAGGGGRSATATALVGICLAGASAGSYCALGGPLPDLAGTPEREPRVERPAARVASAPEASASAGTAPTAATVVVAPVETARTSKPAGEKPARRREAVPTTSAREEPEEFGFEATPVAEPSSPTTPEPTARPATSTAVVTAPAAATAPATSDGGEFGFER